VKESDLATTMVMCARVHIEQEPNYTYVTSRLLLDQLRSEALGFLDIADKASSRHGRVLSSSLAYLI
jgi:ribonucleoside-diphosphate reductase alpha chain